MGIVCFDMPSKKRGRKRKFTPGTNDEVNSSEDTKNPKEKIDPKESPQVLKQVLPKSTSAPSLNVDVSKSDISKPIINKEYRKIVYSQLFPSTRDLSELAMQLFWDVLDRAMTVSYLAKQTKKSNVRFGCSNLIQPLGGEQLLCYSHPDCIKKELYARVLNYGKEKLSNGKEDDRKKTVSESFQTLIESCEVGVVLFNYEDGFIYGFNAKAKDILGQSDEIGKMKNWMDILGAGFFPASWEIITKINIRVDTTSKSFLMDYITYRNKNQKLVQIDTVIAVFLESKYSILILSESQQHQ